MEQVWPASSNEASNGMRILIADDSAVSRRLLEATLRKWNYDVIVAGDGNQAWEVLQQEHPPQLAILDWMMPGRTGLELCRLVRRKKTDHYTYILLLTSKSQREDLIAGMDAGADDYVTKPFDQHELRVRLRAGLRIIELQKELLAAQEALREQATHDSLTRIWNRPAILDILHNELSRAARQNTGLGLVMVDIDNFKRVNDTHGHAAGDAVLREAVLRMQASVRPYDSLGRLGGEEFLVLFAGCDGEQTAGLAERMRLALSSEPVCNSRGSIWVTASFGVTAARGSDNLTVEALLHVVDEALYKAKDSGRDRVVYLPCETVACDIQ